MVQQSLVCGRGVHASLQRTRADRFGVAGLRHHRRPQFHGQGRHRLQTPEPGGVQTLCLGGQRPRSLFGRQRPPRRRQPRRHALVQKTVRGVRPRRHAGCFALQLPAQLPLFDDRGRTPAARSLQPFQLAEHPVDHFEDRTPPHGRRLRVRHAGLPRCILPFVHRPQRLVVDAQQEQPLLFLSVGGVQRTDHRGGQASEGCFLLESPRLVGQGRVRPVDRLHVAGHLFVQYLLGRQCRVHASDHDHRSQYQTLFHEFVRGRHGPALFRQPPAFRLQLLPHLRRGPDPEGRHQPVERLRGDAHQRQRLPPRRIRTDGRGHADQNQGLEMGHQLQLVPDP